MRKFLLTLILTLLVACLMSPALAERILVVGDSITGHSVNLACGYTHEVRKALADAGVTDVEFIPLGGSGQTVHSWQSIVTSSATTDRTLDIPGIYVKQEFDKGADTLLIFLGMNDVLCPQVTDDADCWEQWKAGYQRLIDLLRERCPDAKRLILAAPTMLSESPFSFKNLQMDRMAACVEELARANDASVAPIRADFMRFHENARKQFNTTNFMMDYVHPGEAGHIAITYSILKAIDLESVAQQYLEKRGTDYMKDFDAPGMSLYVVSPVEPGLVRIRGSLRGAGRDQIRVELPDGMKLERVEMGAEDRDGADFCLVLSGNSGELTSVVTVRAGEVERNIALNAPYYVAFGFQTPGFHDLESFRSHGPTVTTTQVDRDVLAGRNPLETEIDGQRVNWLLYRPSRDLTGGDDPNCIDFSALDNGAPFTFAYVVREVYSPREQKVPVLFAVNSFSTNEVVALYVNGRLGYEAFFRRGGDKTDRAEIALREGWNTLVVRSHHTTWQWVLSIKLEGEGLRYR